MLKSHFRIAHLLSASDAQLENCLLLDPLVVTREIPGNMAQVNHLFDERMMRKTVTNTAFERSEAAGLMIAQAAVQAHFNSIPSCDLRQSQESYERHQLSVLIQNIDEH